MRTPAVVLELDQGPTADLLRVLEEIRDIARDTEKGLITGTALTGAHGLRKVHTRADDAIRHYHEDRERGRRG